MYPHTYGPGKGFCTEPDRRAGGLDHSPTKKGPKKCRKYPKKSRNKHRSELVKQSSVGLLTMNAADLRYKDSDLRNKIKYSNSSIFTVQETHFAKRASLLWTILLYLKQ